MSDQAVVMSQENNKAAEISCTPPGKAALSFVTTMATAETCLILKFICFQTTLNRICSLKKNVWQELHPLLRKSISLKG